MLSFVIIGAGGFGREVLDVAEAVNAAAPDAPVWDFGGFVDDTAPELFGRGTVIGATSDLARINKAAVIAVGDPGTRLTLAALLTDVVPALVHPSVTFGSGVVIGEGSVLCAGVRVTTNVTVGRHVHINLNATVGHDTVLGDFVTIYPGANISGSVTLGEEVSIGTNASVLQGVRIGDGATIGAGAVVVGDVPAGVTAKGVPARW